MTVARQEGSGIWSGWVVFAAALMLVLGILNAIQGLAALLKDEVYLVTKSGLLVTADFTAWGWTLLIWGAVLVLAGCGLYWAKGWARWFAIVITALNLIAQFAFFPAYPLWCLIVIALDVVVLFALTMRWSEARGGLLGD